MTFWEWLAFILVLLFAGAVVWMVAISPSVNPENVVQKNITIVEKYDRIDSFANHYPAKVIDDGGNWYYVEEDLWAKLKVGNTYTVTIGTYGQRFSNYQKITEIF